MQISQFDLFWTNKEEDTKALTMKDFTNRLETRIQQEKIPAQFTAAKP